MMEKNILVIGGSGIIGNSLCSALSQSGFSVYSLALDTDEDQSGKVNQLVVNRNDSTGFGSVIGALNSKVGKWAAVIDLISWSLDDCIQLERIVGHNTAHIIIISTTLVYNRKSPLPAQYKISESHPLAKLGELGGYVDKKIQIENYWKESALKNWTILRPYHIIGKYSCLGCCPMHNRDPNLISRILTGQPIRLFHGGNFEINFIHPHDLSVSIIKIIGNPQTFGVAYNAIHPASVKVSDYYALIASIFNQEINIQWVSKEELLSSGYGWELTAMSHIYDGGALYKVSGYIPQWDIHSCIKDAIASQASGRSNHDTVRSRMNYPPRPKKYILHQ